MDAVIATTNPSKPIFYKPACVKFETALEMVQIIYLGINVNL